MIAGIVERISRRNRQRDRSPCRRKSRELATSVRTISVPPARDTRYTANRRRAGVRGHPRSVEIRARAAILPRAAYLKAARLIVPWSGLAWVSDPDYIKIKVCEMGVTEISLHFRKGEKNTCRSRKAARCKRNNRAKERCFIFPIKGIRKLHFFPE